MARLEDLKKNADVKGVLPDATVTVVDVTWHGNNVITLTYKDPAGRVGQQLVYRDHEPTLEVVAAGRAWSFDADGALFRLVSEAQRIRLAHLFDPYLAIHTSDIEPLPHQITAVYGEMLPRQPLRYLLADDPGAGKTIMTGLFLKELLMRGDLQRCLICCPGNLCEQWQDEMYRRFSLPFDIITRETIETARSGNVFAEKNLVICRLDQLSRNEDIQARLKQTDWDVIVCDEAHKMSASFFSGEVKATKRYRLGQLLGSITRHFLLLTATPHNGIEESFQLFMALLDADRFEGRFRDGVHMVDTSDLMRRMVKEHLVKFDGRPLFPERRAYTVNYRLSDAEARLYHEVTSYVREEMNRADRLAEEGQRKRGNMVGFALTILQRRLASSPEAIYQSLHRRRQRLENRLREEQLLKRGAEAEWELETVTALAADNGEIDDFYDETPAEEVETIEEQLVDSASAARTIAELQAEIASLKKLEGHAHQLRLSGVDKKWEELAELLQGRSQAEAGDELFDANGHRRKLIIFTEHRDTLNYLTERIRTLLGRREAVVAIHGGMGREERRKAQELFTQDKDVQILVATDAAGEGINLQRAHLMVNYDLPWNPNRIEQRFGRIHRIGQTEVCHLWNLVAIETREGDVFQRLLEKLEQQRRALGGSVFDVLDRCFTETSLRSLVIEAIRYGDQPEVKARLEQVIDHTLDYDRLRALIEERALTHEMLSPEQVQTIREDMERAAARRLQPHYIASFFREAFQLLGGRMHEREAGRYEIVHVPAIIRSRDRLIGVGEPVLSRYERVTFEKQLANVSGKPTAAFLCPGHPLLDATIDLVLERHRDLLKRGAILVDPDNCTEQVRAVFYLEHAIQDARPVGDDRRVASQRLQFVEIDAQGHVRDAGYAPYLDYRPITDDESALLQTALQADWISGDLESRAVGFAIDHLVPAHLDEVRRLKEEQVRKTMAAVKDRLTKEITYWDHRANELKAQELAGKRNAKINSAIARQRADELEARLQRRMAELEQELSLLALPPRVIGGALIVPQRLIDRLRGQQDDVCAVSPAERERIERLAVAAVMAAERRLGYEPREMPRDHPGYDIESRSPSNGRLRFIEVKGKAADATTVTVSKTQILTALNKPDDFILAIVSVDGDVASEPRYIRRPFLKEPDFGVTSVNYDLNELLLRAEVPK